MQARRIEISLQREEGWLVILLSGLIVQARIHFSYNVKERETYFKILPFFIASFFLGCDTCLFFCFGW